MKKLKYIILSLFLVLCFNTKVKAEDLTGAWAEKILWSDGTTSPGYEFSIWGYNYRQNLTLNNIAWLNKTQSPFGFDAKIIVSDENLYTGAIVKAEVYFLTNYPLQSGKFPYYTTHDTQNDFITITKVADDVMFRGNAGTGSVYKFTYSFKNQDCLDSEFGGRYLCFGDGFIRTFAFGALYTDDVYGIQLYGFGSVKFNDIKWGQSPEELEALKQQEELSVWQTIKALPSKLLGWFTDLPNKIWDGIKSGFNWIVDGLLNLGGYILDLPSNIWNLIKSGFNWIVDGLSDLGTFIINGFEGLFVPEGDFFSIWINDLKINFQSQLGFLYYPIELLFDVLDKYINLSTSTVINIPDIKEPFTKQILIKSQTYDFNSLLANPTINYLHDIWLYFIGGYFIVKFLNLCKNEYDFIIEGIRQTGGTKE